MTTEIAYSDGGAVENRILAFLNEAKDLSSSEAIAHEAYEEWPVRYHLCPERANLVRHFDFSGLDVLELGAGMGGVSRYIAETARSLTVIEGTESRYRALQARLRDLKNWKGIVSNIQDAKLDAKFDVVCVFGVLEYAELYTTPAAGESAFTTFLAKARSFLKDGGALILAIENQLGIKYWSGAAEDHTGRLYDGIVGYPLSKSPRTFSRNELRDLLAKTGLQEIREFFPFPDYKIPSSVLSRELIEAAPELCADLATNQPFQNYGQPRFRALPDALATQTVARAGLLAELSNSFLFVASASDGIGARLLSRARTEAGWHYSASRKVPVRTAFSLEEGKVWVTKAALSGDHRTYESGDLRVRWEAPERAPAVPGTKLRTRLLRHAYFDDWNAFSAELTGFLAETIARYKQADGTLDGRALDAVFRNAAQDGSGFDLFDLEWSLLSPMPISWFVFRNVYLLGGDLDFLVPQAPFKNLGELYEGCCGTLGTRPDLEADIVREARFQVLVTRQGPVDAVEGSLRALFATPFAHSPFLRSPQAANLLGHRKLRQLVETLRRIPGLNRVAKAVLR